METPIRTIESEELLELSSRALSSEQQITQGGPEAAQGKTDFFSFSRDTLKQFLKEQSGESSFRADQLFQWVYRQGIRDFDLMSNLGKSFREKLKELFYFAPLEFRTRQVSLDGTRKYLVEVEKGDLVEAVMIKQPTRMTLCVSSQVGCGMACAFCRTGTMGFKRHLSTAEILRQVMTVVEDAKNFGDMFTNVVFMGMGEPLHNFQGISEAVHILTDDLGLGLAPRKITVSTVGLVPAIKKFGESVPANIAISLNATTDEVRSRIMPINKKYPLEVLLKTLREYPVQKRKKITIEYVLLAGVNDSEGDLTRLPKLLRGIQAKVNLIPYNENAGLGFKTPQKEWVHHWRNVLAAKGLDVTIRWSKGVDISAACGQLATESKRQKRGLEVLSVPEGDNRDHAHS